jgi:type VII secretion-associated serine protease mycosin
MRKKIRHYISISVICSVTCSMTTPALAVRPTPRSEEWWLHQWGMEQKVWPITRGQGVTTALLDGGVSAHLPDLKGRILPGGDTLGGGADGLKDLDPGRHGTYLAALIAAQGQGTGFLGVAPESRVLSIRMNNNTQGSSSAKNMATAIRSAVRQGAKVISMSLATESDAGPAAGVACDPERQAAIDEALQHDVVLVAGAGNNIDAKNIPLQPASCPGVLAVGSVNRKGQPDHHSQPQSYVAVAAPGVEIASLRNEPVIEPKGFIEEDLRGTSFATALVAGVVALVRSRYPQMPAREVLRRITASAQDIAPKGRDVKTGFGIVRPYEALTARLSPRTSNPVYEGWQRSRRERALHPPTKRSQESEEFVPFRTRVIQGGIALGAVLFVGMGAAALTALIIRRRRVRVRTSSPYMQPKPDAETIEEKTWRPGAR